MVGTNGTNGTLPLVCSFLNAVRAVSVAKKVRMSVVLIWRFDFDLQTVPSVGDGIWLLRGGRTNRICGKRRWEEF